MELSVIIPTLANHGYFVKSCESLVSCTRADAEFIVVYNGDSRGTGSAEKLLGHIPRLRIVRTPEYSGISRACNEGFRLSSGAYVAFMHDDLLLQDKSWYEKLRGILDAHPDVGMVGGSEPKYIDRFPAEISGSGAPPEYTECDWSPTLSLARRSDLKNGCLFDESYLMGLEDKDWALCFRRKKLKVAFLPVRHEHPGCQGSYALFRRKIRFLDYYSKEGRRERYFIEKNSDVLKPEYCETSLLKWSGKERNWRKKWWKELYLRHYAFRIAEAFRSVLPGRKK
ncbi:MAG: glycosyltransferase [bacterium]